MVMMIVVVVVVVVKKCIMGVQNLCWSRSLIHTLKMTVSRYVIAGPFQVLPTQLLTTLSTDYCLNENVCDFVLRRTFYSSQLFYKQTDIPLHRHTTSGYVVQG